MSSDSTTLNNNINNNNNKLENVDSYEDDFEPDSNSDDVSKKEKAVIEENGRLNGQIDAKNDEPVRASSPTGVEKGQKEIQTPSRDRSNEEASDNDLEIDADAYNFTEDQKRAMMELLVQKQEDSDLLDEEPPEYNVKGRLEQLNAELANEPTPVEGDRELKVGFKSEIIDLVAPPPPDFSDDESQPNSARGEPGVPGAEPRPDKAQECSETGSGKTDNDSNSADKSKSEENGEKQFVIEREGNFEVLSAEELTPSERAMLIPDSDETEKTKQKESSESASQEGSRSSSSQSSKVVPKPPDRPRPNTAASGPRRNVRPAQSPRPKSAGHSEGSNSSLNNFSYNSPYAMSSEQKEHSREASRKAEEQRKERERRKEEETRKRHEENDRSFQAWLKAKKDDNRQRQDGDENRQQSEQERSQDDEVSKLVEMVAGQSEAPFKTYDVIYPYLLKGKDLKEENEEAYKTWLKEKRDQGKKEKLLKRRQQQEMMESFYVRPRNECDKAFREWLRKKNVDLRRQHDMERQKNKMYRVQVKRSKKTQALLKAMKESQAFRYVDYYGYRY